MIRGPSPQGHPDLPPSITRNRWRVPFRNSHLLNTMFDWFAPTVAAISCACKVASCTEAFRNVTRFILISLQGLTGGQFEENLESLHLQEGKDYYHFN